MGLEWGEGDLIEVDEDEMSRGPIMAAFLNPANKDQAYVFGETLHILMEGSPNALPNRIVGGTTSKLTIEKWPSLKRLNCVFVDAVWPIPGSNVAHFFCTNGTYSRVNVVTHETWGPVNMEDHWTSLHQVAGFDMVDAILPHPTQDSQAYFFSGQHYALIEVHDHFDPLHGGHNIVHGPHLISEDWAPLRKVGFSSNIDMALPCSHAQGKAYFFKGSEYVLIDVSLGTTNDSVYNTSMSIKDNWPALHQARFY